MKIEALHEFHDEEFANEWAEKFRPTPARMRLFKTILKEISILDKERVSILELGIGPGFLADFLLKKIGHAKYLGLDFSESMLKLAARRTTSYKDRIGLVQADLINEDWTAKIKEIPDVVVSTWTLHDLFSGETILKVYKSVFDTLPQGGVLLNGDFIKPEESDFEYEGGRIRPSEHLKLLRSAGFRDVKLIAEFEKDVLNPTTANNYACFRAIK